MTINGLYILLKQPSMKQNTYCLRISVGVVHFPYSNVDCFGQY